MRLNEIGENALLARWWDVLRRNPAQRNGVQEADAELIPLSGATLAMTIDTVAEECALGLYPDAETAGWVEATASLSDLGAVGAEPIGVLVSVTLASDSAQAGIARGLDAACRAAGTYVLGGDTNFGDRLAITTAAIGTVAKPLMRTGCRPGELVFVTGRMGAGACCAARALFGVSDCPPFRPTARIPEGRALAGVASACIDTSDGLVAALDQLARLNGVGFEIAAGAGDFIDPSAAAVCRRLGVPELLALAQPHGEFELVFTVPEDRVHEIRNGIPIGRTIAAPEVRIKGRAIDTAAIRNAVWEAAGNPGRCLESLRTILTGGVYA